MAQPLFHRIGLLTMLLLVAWCVMTFTHELGHILCGWACGGTLTSVELRPWHLPHSLFQPDPFPLMTLWGGPVLGVAIPVALGAWVRRPWSWFITYFCILANGLYLAAGWATGDRYLDTPQLLWHGAYPAAIALYCLMTITIGYVGLRRQWLDLLSPPTSKAGALRTRRAS